jgi:hypothetical protein
LLGLFNTAWQVATFVHSRRVRAVVEVRLRREVIEGRELLGLGVRLTNAGSPLAVRSMAISWRLRPDRANIVRDCSQSAVCLDPLGGSDLLDRGESTEFSTLSLGRAVVAFSEANWWRQGQFRITAISSLGNEIRLGLRESSLSHLLKVIGDKVETGAWSIQIAATQPETVMAGIRAPDLQVVRSAAPLPEADDVPPTTPA